MRRRLDEPIFTQLFAGVEQVPFEADGLLITGASVEERSHYPESWDASAAGLTVMEVVAETPSTMSVEVEGQRIEVGLRSEKAMLELLAIKAATARYLDITGLPHHVWAPILRGLRTLGAQCLAMYVEPLDYRRSVAPTETTIFDLSESIRGIAPIPGFASLARPEDDDAVFVSLLGFEGARFAHVLEVAQPKATNVWPVVGVPGFRAEYPFYTFLGNGMPLRENRSWTNAFYARANCPFSLYQVLGEIAGNNPGRRMKIAPIGTKPHALGAVLYCLDYPDMTELVYDHPIRKPARTAGASRVCLYDLGLLPPVRRRLRDSGTAVKGDRAAPAGSTGRSA